MMSTPYRTPAEMPDYSDPPVHWFRVWWPKWWPTLFLLTLASAYLVSGLYLSGTIAFIAGVALTVIGTLFMPTSFRFRSDP